MSDARFIDTLVQGYKGIAQNWECDMNNHLNVSHFFGRSSDHAFYMRHALAMSPRQMVADRRGTVALEEHARFHREVRAGGMMIGRSAPVEIGEKTMTVYQEFRDPQGRLQTSFKTVIGHFDLEARRLTPWSDETLARAHALRIDLPDHAAPKFVAPGRPAKPIALTQTLADGFFKSGGNGINAWECDQFGHLNTMFYIRRQTEAVPHFWAELGFDLPTIFKGGNGFVVGEMRVAYLNELREGDMVDTYSAVREVDDKTVLAEHRMYNVETGDLSARTVTRAVFFDAATRRACAWPDAMRAKLEARCIDIAPIT
jgi:acyl-CoA thioester hydrolase